MQEFQARFELTSTEDSSSIQGTEKVSSVRLALRAVTFMAGGDGVGGGIVAAGDEGHDVVQRPGARAKGAEAVEAVSAFAGENSGAEFGVAEASSAAGAAGCQVLGAR